MRFIIDALFLGLYLVLGIPVLLVLHLIGKVDKWKYKSDLAALRLVQWAFKVMLWVAGTKQTVIGEENVDKEAQLEMVKEIPLRALRSFQGVDNTTIESLITTLNQLLK